MSFLEKLRGKGGHSRIVLFDIGSASVAGAIVVLSRNKPPHIEHCRRRVIPFQEEVDQRRTAERLVQTLDTLAQELLQKNAQGEAGARRFEEIACIVSSPFVRTETLTASYAGKAPFEVTGAVMDTLLRQIREKTVSQEVSMVIIDEAVISSSLNGYSTPHPLGKTAQNIKIALLKSSIPAYFKDAIESAVEKHFGSTPISFHSFSLAAFSVVRDVFEKEHDFLIVEITGEMTEIAVVRNDTLIESLSFPYGRHTIIRNTAKSMGSIPEDAEAKIGLFLAHGGGEAEEAVQQEGRQWSDLFGKACAELSSDALPLPNSVFLISDSRLESWFADSIARVDFSQFTATSEPFAVTPLRGKKAVEGYCTIDTGGNEDAFLVIGSLFYDKVGIATKISGA